MLTFSLLNACALKSGSSSSGTEPTLVNVYAVGEYYDGTNHISAIWKNGIKNDFLDEDNADIGTVFVSGNDVYVGGSNAIWKNGIKTELTDGTNPASIRSIFVK